MGKELLIETNNLSKSFGERKIINNLNLKVEKGDIYGFLGANGSGKTTTIRMILGLIFPSAGQISLNGSNISKDFKKAITKVGAIVENPSFYTYLSGEENLKLMANLHSGLEKNRVAEVLEIVKLSERKKDKVKSYSLGMKQRLGIAMALLNKPTLVILDEPTNGLDPQGMKEIKDTIIQLSREEGITFFISSHLLHEVEQICSKVGILKNGKLVVQDSINELLKSQFEDIDIITPNKEKAMELLNKVDFVKTVRYSENGIIINLPKGNSSKINQLLVSNNIEVITLTVRNNSLEKIFFDIA